MAELLESGHQVAGLMKLFWITLQNTARQQLWMQKQKTDVGNKAARARMNAGRLEESFKRILEEVQENYPTRTRDHFHQFDRDTARTNNSSIIELIKGKDIVLVLDVNKAIVAFALQKGVQSLYSAKALNAITECLIDGRIIRQRPRQTQHDTLFTLQSSY